ncbi:hypothetical protein [Arthrobacter sp. 162MFSha1.1]|uniref:hypothetical protein n=1 Tax=Arthrobacter sp. 162MFSha1.1 TaxID=1151119 RepID=UPI00037810F5|nr:hypothetical protein [Arthrobacter sp. 162MFSha1.1]
MSTQAVPTSPAFAGPSHRQSSKKKLVIALAIVIVGILLAVFACNSGNTFAMWRAQVTQNGETMHGGNFGITKPSGPGYFDTSPDRTPTAIDLNTFRTVPGDQISISQAQAITMVGNNLAADWSVEIPDGGALTGALATPGSGVTGKVYFGKGTYDPTTFNPADALASASLDGSGPIALVHFNQPTLNGGVSYLNDGSLTDGTAKVFAVTVIDYAASATDTTIQATQANLSAINYTLTQVR